MRGALMVCGTGSDAGKTQIVTGLCRLLHRQGVNVAPFKGQNMSLNSYVTADGAEIGRAQGIQARAAGLEPEAIMNPVLLKPTGERVSQVVVLGQPIGHLTVTEYHAAKADLERTVHDALAQLRQRFDVVLCEGAGSPAEINLLDHDLVNLGVAAAAGIDAVVVGDIERGGVFASLYGTVALLPDELRRRIRGFIINKFRGDAALLRSGVVELERRSGLPTFGVLPWIEGLDLDAEDSLALERLRPATVGTQIDVAAVRFPRISNFTDLDPLSIEPGVRVRLVTTPGQLGDPDLIVLPGTKATVADLDWFRFTGLAAAVQATTATVLGICGGYQMLGTSITDGIESGRGEVPGLGWIPATTEFQAEKIVRRDDLGYEIRHGIVESSAEPWAGGVRVGRFLGTPYHGLLEADEFRAAFLAEVATRRGKHWQPGRASFEGARQAQWDRVADALEAHLDLDAIQRIIEAAA